MPTGWGTAPPYPALRATFSRQGRKEEGVASFSAFGNAGGYFRFSSQMFILWGSPESWHLKPHS